MRCGMCGGGIRGWRCRIRGNRALRLSLRHEIVVSNKIFDELSLPSLNVRISATSQTPTFPFGERNRYRATAHAVFPSTISCLTSTDVVSRKKALRPRYTGALPRATLSRLELTNVKSSAMYDSHPPL